MKVKRHLKSIIILLFATLFLIACIVVSDIVNKNNNKEKVAFVNGVGVGTDEIKNALTYIDLGKVTTYPVISIEKSGMVNEEVFICFDEEISDAEMECTVYKKEGTQKTKIGRFTTTAETDSYKR